MDTRPLPDDPWVKIVDMLQHNWALIDIEATGSVRVLFFHDGGVIFDKMEFASEAVAAAALQRNGFRRWSESPELQEFVQLPPDQLEWGTHPNGDIYSSGRFWKS